MKPGEHRRQQSPEITMKGAIKILKTLTESLTQNSMKSFTGEQHPGDESSLSMY